MLEITVVCVSIAWWFAVRVGGVFAGAPTARVGSTTGLISRRP